MNLDDAVQVVTIAVLLLAGLGAGWGTLRQSKRKGEQDGLTVALQELDAMTRRAQRLQGENDTLTVQLRAVTRERDTLSEVIAKALQAREDRNG